MEMAELSADYLKLKERQVLSVTAETEQRPQGFGRVGKLPEPMSLKECALYVKEALDVYKRQVPIRCLRNIHPKIRKRRSNLSMKRERSF